MDSNLSKGLKIAGLVVLGLVLGYLINGWVGQSNDQATNKMNSEITTTSEAFIKALTSGSVDVAYAQGTSAYRARNSKARVQSVSDSLKTSTAEVSAEEVYIGPKDKAIFVATVDNLPANSSGRTTGNFIITLQHDLDGWKIDSSQTY